MKYIIIGLGNFGASLAQKLTAQGNEVIGVDKDMYKVDLLKEKISHTICMDATDESTMTGLPLLHTDIVIVAIGENQGANIMATALLKNMKVKRIISRAIDNLHEQVLTAIGVDDIVHPEEETAERWSKKLCLSGIVDSFELSDAYSIVEVHTPSFIVGKRVKEVNFRANHNLLLLTTLKKSEVNPIVGRSRNVLKVQGLASPDLLLEEDDILVVYGANSEIDKFLKSE